MPTTYTASARFSLQATGENNNTWGSLLNTGTIQLIDFNINGWTTKALSGDYSLTTANGAADEARSAMLKFTGTGPYNVTIPSVSKRYDVWNACTAALTITNGSASVVIQAGEVCSIITDGGTGVQRVAPRVFGGGITVAGASSFTGALNLNASQINNVLDPTSPQDAATKAYVDATAFNMAAGSLPGQTGNAGKFLTTNGSVASWGYAVNLGAGLASVSNATLTVNGAASADVLTGTTTAKAMTPGDTYNAFAEVTLTDAATIAVDMSTFINAKVTLGGNRALGNPTNPKVGQSGFIRLIQDGTGSRTLSLGGNWKRPGGPPTLTTTPGAVDVLEYQVITSTYILYNVLANPS